MADIMRINVLFLLLVALSVICTCDKSMTNKESGANQNTGIVTVAANTVSAEAGISKDQSLVLWENCIVRNYLQKPSMFSIMSYIRSNVNRPEIFHILIDRFLAECKTGVLPFSRADLYQIASGVSFNISTPSEPATGKSYFTDSSVVFILQPDVESEGFYLGSMWRYPLQDWCSNLSDSTPEVSFDRTSNTIEAVYHKPVPVTFICGNGVVSAEIATVKWPLQANESQSVLTVNQSIVSREKLMGIVISKVPVSIDSVSVSWQSWCSWSIDINKDSIADIRTITSGDTVTNNGSFDLFAQVNIDGQWVTSDYKIGCIVRAIDDGSGVITRSYTHREWNVWDSYSMGTDAY